VDSTQDRIRMRAPVSDNRQGWSSSFGFGRGGYKLLAVKNSLLWNVTQGLGPLWGRYWTLGFYERRGIYWI